MSKNIELRNDELDEILEKHPTWFVRFGIIIFSSIVILMLAGAYIFKYPDIISTKISIVTENIPIILFAKTEGRITQLFVTDKEKVEKEKILAIIENTADYNHVFELKSELERFYYKNESDTIIWFVKRYNLGELQSQYSELQKRVTAHRIAIENDYFFKKIKSFNSEIESYRKLSGKQKQQSKLYEEQLSISQKQFARDSILHLSKAISDADFEKNRKEFIDKQLMYENSKTASVNIQISISQLEQQIIDLQSKQNENFSEMKNSIIEVSENLKAKINKWEQDYIIKSPIDGVVSLSGIWKNNQYIHIGERIMGIVPEKESKIMARMQLPMNGAGKVKSGQQVNIKLDHFPFMEYGTINGEITDISLISDNAFYIADVKLTNNLVTNRGNKLTYTPEMLGTADIITENKSLLARLFENLITVLAK
ncbi:MAG: hypothetical protein A2033_13235 [Bacteroidetes bacterium GWA2_31_9]|nr:MAG: hypothetical protein A2033_13235 [Bacteroidetes bacterium GWA2_31_9]